MILAVNEAMSALNASAMARPTATVTMSPRMRKFLNPVNTLRTLPSRPRRLRAVRCGGASRPAVDADHIVPGRPENRQQGYGRPDPEHPDSWPVRRPVERAPWLARS